MADSRPEFPQEWRDALKRDGALPAGSCDCDECVGNVLTALAEVGALRDPDAETIEEWRVTGDLGDNYPPYDFTWSPFRDPIRGGDPEPAARAFVAMVRAHDKPWRDGPHLTQRTVTVTKWEAPSD